MSRELRLSTKNNRGFAPYLKKIKINKKETLDQYGEFERL